MRDQSARHLDELTDKHVPAKCRAGIELSEHHSVREGIAELVERVQPDVVCLASHGRTGLKHVVLGSIAEHTLRTAGVPVMVVKKTVPPAADEPLRVLIALDFGERREKRVGAAAKPGARGGVDLLGAASSGPGPLSALR